MTSDTKSKPFKWKWGETKSLIITALEKNGPMAPIQIADYLGLTIETVSRAFSRFQEDGHIAVQQKHIRILNVNGLKALMNHRP